MKTHAVGRAAACGGARDRRALRDRGVATEKVDFDAINKIKQQGLNPANSQVMEISSWLEDVYGPRLTGSPNVEKAGRLGRRAG